MRSGTIIECGVGFDQTSQCSKKFKQKLIIHIVQCKSLSAWTFQPVGLGGN